MKKLEGKIAIVTGSGRGIGQAIALKLASEGAKLVVNDLDAGPTQETIAKIRALGSDAISCDGDVTAPDFGARIVKTTLDAYGGIDIIVNNAGYAWDGVIQKMSDEQWYAMLDVHATAPFRILRAASDFIRNAAKKEKDEGRGVNRKVVNISSIAGLYGNAGQMGYSAGKAAIVGMTKTMAKEWGRYRVNVNCVAFRADPDAHDPARGFGRGGGEDRRTRSQDGDTAGVHRVHEQDDPARPRRHSRGGGWGGVPDVHTRIGLHQRRARLGQWRIRHVAQGIDNSPRAQLSRPLYRDSVRRPKVDTAGRAVAVRTIVVSRDIASAR